MKRNFLFIQVLFLLTIYTTNVFAQKSAIRDTEIYKLNLAAQSILVNYVDEVDKSKLVEDAIKGMLEDLDPHSSYLTPDQVKRANEPLQGNFKGVGIEFNILKDTLLVVAVIEGGPSEKAGIRPGDRILTVDGKNIAGIGLKNSDVIDKLRGEEGTVVEIQVLRRGEKELLAYDIIRGKIPIYSVDASYMVSKQIGYIKINRFGATTHAEFLKAMRDLRRDGMKKLILDLQGNGGGYLWASIQMANEFINKENLIVYTKNRMERKNNYADSKGIFEKKELVVLVDEGSASASEILSGAIQDWDRGVIIGRRTFGKGLVQRPFRLNDGSEIRLTISRYYTPSGRSIQKSYENGRGEYRKDFSKRIEHGELFYADSIKFPDSLKFTTLKHKRFVYGGGGIMPDIFVPLDTTYNSKFFREINRSGLLNRFTLDYVDSQRNTLANTYLGFETFNTNFEITDEIYQEMIAAAKRDHIEYDESAVASRNIIRLQMKAYIARYLFEREHFFRVMKNEDEAYLKAIEVLNNTEQYKSILTGGNAR